MSGLTAASVYHYRLVAVNDSGTSYGADRTFQSGGRRAPRSVGIRVAHAQSKSRPYRYQFAGLLSLPGGMTNAQGCSGKLTVVVRKGHRLIASHRVSVSRTCTYKSTFSFKKLNGSGSLFVHAHYLGNNVLTPANSKTIKVHFG
jgi:hypothetical protein